MPDKILSRSLPAHCPSKVALLEHQLGQSARVIRSGIQRRVSPLHWRVEEISICKNRVLPDGRELDLLPRQMAHKRELRGVEYGS